MISDGWSVKLKNFIHLLAPLTSNSRKRIVNNKIINTKNPQNEIRLIFLSLIDEKIIKKNIPKIKKIPCRFIK